MGGEAEDRFTADEVAGFEAVLMELGELHGRFDAADAAALALCRSLFRPGAAPSPADIGGLLGELERRGRIEAVDTGPPAVWQLAPGGAPA